MSGRRDSNPESLEPESSAIAVTLRPAKHKYYTLILELVNTKIKQSLRDCFYVGTPRFEPINPL